MANEMLFNKPFIYGGYTDTRLHFVFVTTIKEAIKKVVFYIYCA